ncbi:tonsoku-like protein [Ceratina calcarata]|uniref:Tonsoku-like protein n=1 Tax=Ceratina calcarata TaxID=156304 RepID=A0AAJ7N7I3_9HYME|nr:tonsoku-like protein [Ceratina calcarata]
MDIDRLIKRKKRVQRDGSLKQLAEIVKELGDAYYEIGKYEDALQEYKEQLETCDALGDKLNAAVSHRMIGETHVNLGNYEDALDHQNLYLEGAKETENLLEEQRAYATLGRTYFCWAESLSEDSEKRPDALRSAKKAYMKSIRLCNELENTDIGLKELTTMRARLLLNLGLVLEAQQDHKEAVGLMEKAATMCESHNLREDFHRTQIALGGIYDRNRDYDLALKHFEIAAEIDNLNLKAEARIFQAELLLKIERWHESRKMLVSLYVTDNLPVNLKQQVEKLLRIVATLHATEEALSEEESTDGRLKLYETLGDAAVAARCFEKAIEYYKKMLACAEEIKSDRTGAALLSLAQTLKDVGRYHEALDFAGRELKLCVDPREICRSALYLADLMIITEATEENIQHTYALAYTNAEACNDVTLQISVLKERLDYLNKLGRTEEVKILNEKLAALLELCSNVDSESEREENDDIGADIRLEELSDVEEQLIAKENVRSRKRTRKKPVAVKRNEKGETQLHVACINGNIEAAEKLLESGHATNVRDHFGWTPLHEAANHNHIEIAKLLLKHGADIDDSGSLMCQGVTPLHDAASCGNLAMMKLLIEHGANVQLKTNEDETVLDCLEQWRDRVDSLSSEDQADYDEMFSLLCAMIPKSIRKNSKRYSQESPSTSKTHVVEENVVAGKISPGEDYKRTIANLKHRSDPIGMSVSAKRNANPLLDSQDVLVDDWLEDDMSGAVNDRRCSDEHTTSISKRKSSSSLDIEKMSKRQKYNDQDSVLIDNEPDTVEETSNDSCNSEIIQVSNERRVAKRKQQSSLLSIGFTKNPVSRTPSPITPSPTEFEAKESSSMKSIILNVSVDGKVFKTQVECSSTVMPSVQDIINDIQTKFYYDTGCRAKLELKTMDNIAINPNNLFTILNEGDIVKKLTCDMIELETCSLCDRYGTICKNYNIDVRECVSKCLKSCENTSILRLKQETIRREEFTCLLKALEYQKNIQILDLSGGELNETGEVLNNCILRLPGLQELCLRECDIDSKCLSKLKKLPLQLKLLDLSYNPLGFASQEILSKLLNPLTQLRTLNLRYCQLRDFEFFSNTNNLVHLDVSWNNFNEDKPFPSLQRQLLHLNLSNTIPNRECSIAKSILNKTDFSPVNLECLELSSCRLLDTDVEHILSQLTNLSKLVLRGNKNVGTKSLNLLLGYTPTLRYIDIGGCDDIADLPNSDTYIDNPETCTLVASVLPEVCDCWVRLWRKKGTVKRLSHNLTIFKPILSFDS